MVALQSCISMQYASSGDSNLSGYCIQRSRKRCNSKIVQGASFETHIFSAIFLRFPTAPCFTVQTGQGLGGGLKFFGLPGAFFSQNFFAVECSWFCALSIVWYTVKPDSRQCEKCPFCPQFCQFLVWLGFVIVTKTKPNLNCAKNGGNVVRWTLNPASQILYLRAAIGISLEQQY